MSLVNDMLRDLDRRRRHPVEGGSGYVVIDGDGEYTGRGRLLVIAAIAILAAVVVTGVLYVGTDVPRSDASGTAAVETAPLLERAPDSAQTETEVQETAGPGITARIAGERNRTNGFELRLESTAETPFEVLTRTDKSLEVLLSGVTSLANSITSLNMVAMEVVDDGLLVRVDLERDADFVVYENSNAFTFAVAIEGYWKVLEELAAPAVEILSQAEDSVPGESSTAGQVALSQPAAQADATRGSTQSIAPVRTQRQLSLQDRDRNVTQQALQQVQSGQMQTAYATLQNFIARNPEAHQARNTLITLLYAQQQYDQVGLQVEEGLSLAPNLSSYKKMKARLLMMQGRHQDAIILLRNVPPAVGDDTEYFELLASLYQHTGDFSSAIATYQDLIRIDSNVGRWWTGMGISHESQGNAREAVNSFEVALQVPGLESNLRQYSRNRIKSLSGN